MLSKVMSVRGSHLDEPRIFSGFLTLGAFARLFRAFTVFTWHQVLALRAGNPAILLVS